MWKWVQRIVVVMIAAFAVLYLGDWAVYTLRGSPQGSVTVNRTLSVPLKGNKTEFDYLGSSQVPCSMSLFPQGGESPCWQLRRNQNQNTRI
jgi:hypothetical protein